MLGHGHIVKICFRQITYIGMMTKERSTKILNILTPRQVSCDKAWPYKLYNEHDYLLLYQYANVLRDCGAVFLAIVEFC